MPFRSDSRRPVRAAAVLVLAFAAGACEARSAVSWLDPDPVAVTFAPAASAATDASAATRLDAWLAALLDTTPRTPAPPSTPLPPLTALPAPDTSLGDGPLPSDTAACPGSWRTAASPRGTVAVWWSQRPGGRVHLVAAWRDSAGADTTGARGWRGPIPVDTLDVGVTDARDADRRGLAGCARPAPAVAVDARNGYVHVTYALVAPEGGGLFYAHQMDPRAAFEPPVPVLYGDRLGTTHVASDGDVVVVAYEDPNSLTRPRVGLAVSRLAGHLFERRVVVDDGEVPADAPRVAVRGGTVAVAWRAVPRGGAEADARWLVRRAVVR